MPERVYKKFADDTPTQTKSTDKSSTSKGNSPTSGSSSSKKHRNGNHSTLPPSVAGSKRFRDGSPKVSSDKKPSADLTNKSNVVENRENDGVNGIYKRGSEASSSSKNEKVNGVSSDGGASKKSKTGKGDGGSSAGSASRKPKHERREGHSRGNGGRQQRPHTSNHTKLRQEDPQLLKARKELPIWAKKADIQYALRKNDVLVLSGETGSGKSTQVPQFLSEEPWCVKKLVKVRRNGDKVDVNVGGIIAITQPRRVAAITLAQRVAREMGTPLQNGEDGLVGFAVRFNSVTPRGMKIKFVTEGILLQEMLNDPYLRKYSAVIVDEIHERSMDVDLIAGFLRKLVHGNKKGRGGIPLKVVIMSATLDMGGIEAYFAKPGSRPGYQPGKNYGRMLAPHMWDDEVDEEIVSDESRRSSTSESSWAGFSDSTGERKELEAEKNDNVFAADEPDEVGIEIPNATRAVAEVASDTGVAIEHVEGRQFPVDVFFEAKPPTDYLQVLLSTIIQIHVGQPMPGDILAFLTGQEEIESLQTQLEIYGEKLAKQYPRMKILPLYGSLSADAQQLAFEKVKEKFTRKIVLATNIAETSVTVSGVRYVVDCGKSKVKQYRPRLGMESLLAKPISAVSAVQRKGRAGREAPGKCYRIYTEKDFDAMKDDEVPAILRCDPIEAVLKMKARGVKDVLNFPLMDSPDVGSIKKALLDLHTLGALGDNAELTAIGMQMASFPLPVAFGRVLIAASEDSFDVLLEAIDVISCLTSDSEIYLQPKSEDDQENITENRKDIIRREGDLITLLTTMQLYTSEHADRVEWCKKRLISFKAMRMAMAIRKQLRQQCVEMKLLPEPLPVDPQPFEPITPERAEVLIKAFLKAFSVKTAVLAANGSYKTTSGKHEIQIHPSSVLHGRKMEAIMFLDNVYTSKYYAKKVSSIQADWIVEALEV